MYLVLCFYYYSIISAILVYNITSYNIFTSLLFFINDARALASPNFTLLFAGNKLNLADSGTSIDTGPLFLLLNTLSSVSSKKLVVSVRGRWIDKFDDEHELRFRGTITGYSCAGQEGS